MSVQTVIDVVDTEIQKTSDSNTNIKSRCVEICRVKYKCFLLLCTLITVLCINLFQILNAKIDGNDLKYILLTMLRNTTHHI